MTNRPESDIDLYSDSVLQEPYPFYRQLRDQAPAVWLKPTGMYALTRFEDVRDALRNWQVFSSARGVAMNEEINEAIAGNTLGSDPPRHQHLRSILVRPLMPDAMREVTALIETVLHAFAGSSDGANPSANLVQGSDGALYGSTDAGGTKGFGTFFKVALQ
jgi:uncharacterized repeat protein (TIGR03803 family)